MTVSTRSRRHGLLAAFLLAALGCFGASTQGADSNPDSQAKLSSTKKSSAAVTPPASDRVAMGASAPMPDTPSAPASAAATPPVPPVAEPREAPAAMPAD